MFLCFPVKIIVDGLCQLPAHTGSVFQLVGGGVLHRAHALELRQQGFGGFGAYARHALKLVEQLCPGRDMSDVMNGLMNEPIDPARLASQVRSPEQSDDLYRLSCLIVDVDHFMERSYLDGLASALHLSAERKAALEQEVAQARRQLLPG